MTKLTNISTRAYSFMNATAWRARSIEFWSDELNLSEKASRIKKNSFSVKRSSSNPCATIEYNGYSKYHRELSRYKNSQKYETRKAIIIR